MHCQRKFIGVKFLVISSLSAIATLFFYQPLAIAETKSLNFKLASGNNQTFTNLMQQAETLAINSITQEFAQQSTVTEVAVTIIGERNGQEVPILFSKVSRPDWQTKPNIQMWTKYFTKAAVLLGFNQLPKTKLDAIGQFPIVTTSVKPLPADDSDLRDD